MRCTQRPRASVHLVVGRVYHIGARDEVVCSESKMVALDPADPDLKTISVAKDLLRWPFFDAVT
ncbi:MAG: hypothetical protein WCW66_05835 [Patescibacteria group bacterium]